jgi:putative FmdB family regulatory protein
MPIYAYRCESCSFEKDVLQKISDSPLTQCPHCGQDNFRKQVTAAGFQLKGSGWYVTDFRNGNGAAKGNKASAKADGGESGAPAGGGDSGAAGAANAPKGGGDNASGTGGTGGTGGAATAASATSGSGAASSGASAGGTPSSGA